MISDYSKTVEHIRTELSNYIKANGLKALVIGISGGIDSALVAALTKPVCEQLNIPLIGRSITIETNKENEIVRAKHVGEAYTNNFKEVDLTEAYLDFKRHVMENEQEENRDSRHFKIRTGNLKARIRMTALYDLAAKHKGMVMSTDNYTELLLGFWTLHGDVGDYGAIQNIWKTEVYEMSEFLIKTNPNIREARALSMCIEAIPTDGLGITDSDLEQIGAETYFEVDEILIKYLKNPDNKELKSHPVIQRFINSEYKRTNPYNLARKHITDLPLF
ncbi:MAG: NAD(+) synthase [Bacteroidota bacterium]|nr:NAD(+) synthase [Bacteroidota bacterium]